MAWAVEYSLQVHEMESGADVDGRSDQSDEKTVIIISRVGYLAFSMTVHVHPGAAPSPHAHRHLHGRIPPHGATLEPIRDTPVPALSLIHI